MTGDTWISLLHGLIGPALSKRRAELKVAADTRALLLADAWTGFHSETTGLQTSREAWSLQNFCDMPAKQECGIC